MIPLFLARNLHRNLLLILITGQKSLKDYADVSIDGAEPFHCEFTVLCLVINYHDVVKLPSSRRVNCS